MYTTLIFVIWNWYTKTIWHNLASVPFDSSEITPPYCKGTIAAASAIKRAKRQHGERGGGWRQGVRRKLSKLSQHHLQLNGKTATRKRGGRCKGCFRRKLSKMASKLSQHHLQLNGQNCNTEEGGVREGR